MSREVVTSYPIRCAGVNLTEIASLPDYSAQASLTIYKDGIRSVGCPYLSSGICHVASSKLKCIQLFPETSEGVSPNKHERAQTKYTIEVDGDAIGRLRLGSHLSQRALGEATQISDSFLSLLENGRARRLGLSKAERLASVLGVDLEQLKPCASGTNS